MHVGLLPERVDAAPDEAAFSLRSLEEDDDASEAQAMPPLLDVDFAVSTLRGCRTGGYLRLGIDAAQRLDEPNPEAILSSQPTTTAGTFAAMNPVPLESGE